MNRKRTKSVDASLAYMMLLKARIEAFWIAQCLDGVKIDVFLDEWTNLYSLRSNIVDLLTVRTRDVYSTGDE